MKVLFRLILNPLFLIVLLAIALAAGGYSYSLYFRTQKELKELRDNPRVIALEEAEEIIKRVSSLVDLPQDEIPTVATITDVEKLKDRAFFAKAENGDKVLIYNQRKRAILYRPDTNKVIEVAPVNIGDTNAEQQADQVPDDQKVNQAEETQPTPVEQIPKPLKLALYNGTTNQGITYTIEGQLKEKLTEVEFEIVARNMAARTNYAKSLVVDLTGNLPQTAQKFATILNGEVGELPTEENKAEADLLIIVGAE